MKEEWKTEEDHYGYVFGGVVCEIRRSSLGSLCGYAHVTTDHPWYGLGYDEIHRICPDLDVHGGLTFADKDSNGHYMIGFDCAHCGDVVPQLKVRFENDVYRNREFVERELRKLAEQIRKAAKPNP